MKTYTHKCMQPFYKNYKRRVFGCPAKRDSESRMGATECGRVRDLGQRSCWVSASTKVCALPVIYAVIKKT